MKSMRLLKKLIGKFLRILGIYQYKIVFLNDNPRHEDVKSNIIYIVGDHDYAKWAYMKCPDNCGENIMLNLSPKRRPSWTIIQDNFGRVSIYPSVHKLEGCKSHFWVKKGRLFIV